MKKVELQSAYFWTCDDCSSNNFSMPRKMEFGPGEKEEAYRHFHDMDDWEELPKDWECFEMVCVPIKVTCEKCGAEFETMDEERVF